LDKMKEAYHVNLYGNDPKVLDGSWKELFADTKVGEADEKKATGDDNEAGETGDGNAGGNGKRKRGREKGQGTLDGMVKREKKLSG
jgi:cryptochrome